MTSSIHTVKDAADQGRGGGCCLGDITAEAGLARASGDVTHLQAALLSFEPRLALGEQSRRAESCVVWKKNPKDEKLLSPQRWSRGWSDPLRGQNVFGSERLRRRNVAWKRMASGFFEARLERQVVVMRLIQLWALKVLGGPTWRRTMGAGPGSRRSGVETRSCATLTCSVQVGARHMSPGSTTRPSPADAPLMAFWPGSDSSVVFFVCVFFDAKTCTDGYYG